VEDTLEKWRIPWREGVYSNRVENTLMGRRIS
jgi:hypothetical protein